MAFRGYVLKLSGGPSSRYPQLSNQPRISRQKNSAKICFEKASKNIHQVIEWWFATIASKKSYQKTCVRTYNKPNCAIISLTRNVQLENPYMNERTLSNSSWLHGSFCWWTSCCLKSSGISNKNTTRRFIYDSTPLTSVQKLQPLFCSPTKRKKSPPKSIVHHPSNASWAFAGLTGVMAAFLPTSRQRSAGAAGMAGVVGACCEASNAWQKARRGKRPPVPPSKRQKAPSSWKLWGKGGIFGEVKIGWRLL